MILVLIAVLVIGTALKMTFDPDNSAYGCPDPNCDCNYKKIDPSRFIKIKRN